jgi:small subunit ribosomal protein S21
MSVRIVLSEGEPIGLALRRFKKLLERNGVTRDQRRQEDYVKPSQIRRAKRFKKKFKARRATLLEQTEGKQPVVSIAEAHRTFWKRTGKP